MVNNTSAFLKRKPIQASTHERAAQRHSDNTCATTLKTKGQLLRDSQLMNAPTDRVSVIIWLHCVADLGGSICNMAEMEYS